MFRLLAEPGRRNAIRVAAVYAGVAWGILNARTIFAEAWDVPHWTVQFLTFLLALGFPVVLGFSWIYELTPEGFRRSAEVELNPALSQRTARRLDITIIGLMVALGGMLGAEIAVRLAIPFNRRGRTGGCYRCAQRRGIAETCDFTRGAAVPEFIW